MSQASVDLAHPHPTLDRPTTILSASLRPALLLLAVVAVVLAVMPFDGPLSAAIARAAPDQSLQRVILKRSNYVFGVWSYVAVAALLLWQADRVRLLIGYGTALLTGFGAVHLLKLVFGRARPDLHAGSWHFQWFGDGRLGYDSFPSAHTAQAFVFVALVVIYFGRWGWVLGVPALMVGLARIAQERHFVSDVLLGATLPVLVILAVWQYLGPLYFRRLLFRRRPSDAATTLKATPESAPQSSTASPARESS